MQFSQQTIYDDHFEIKASEIFIAHAQGVMKAEEIDLLEHFMQIINDEMDTNNKNFKLIVPDIFYPYIGQMSDSIKQNLSIKVNAASRDLKSIKLMQQIAKDGYDLSIEVKDQFVLSMLPKDTKFVFIDADIFTILSPEQMSLLAGYECVACCVDDYEKVDTLREQAVKLFCGKFIESPRNLEVQTISPSKAAILSLMASLSDPDIELSKVTHLSIQF